MTREDASAESLRRAKQAKQTSRGWSDDMSSAAIERRLRIVADLHRAWLVLRTARPVERREADGTG